MVNLSTRSYKKELLDRDDIPFEDIRQNMRELNTVNRLLGGHNITLKGVRSLLPFAKNIPLTICEIGCGGGDNLNAIHTFCNKNKIAVSLIGIDIKKECVDFAKQQYPELPAQWICSDYSKVNFAIDKPAIIFSSLFCHHFTGQELVKQLLWMKENCSTGFFINDLHRNSIAYYSIKWITGIFSRSYLVKNDAPLSVARGFTKNEWQSIFLTAGLPAIHIQWKWAFRHLITYRHG